MEVHFDEKKYHSGSAYYISNGSPLKICIHTSIHATYFAEHLLCVCMT